jgi:hypothetical protein
MIKTFQLGEVTYAILFCITKGQAGKQAVIKNIQFCQRIGQQNISTNMK